MRKSIAMFTGLMLAACGQNGSVDSAKPAVKELPAFNTYSAAQMQVLSAFGMAEFDASKISTVPLRGGMAVIFGMGRW